MRKKGLALFGGFALLVVALTGCGRVSESDYLREPSYSTHIPVLASDWKVGSTRWKAGDRVEFYIDDYSLRIYAFPARPGEAPRTCFFLEGEGVFEVLGVAPAPWATEIPSDTYVVRVAEGSLKAYYRSGALTLDCGETTAWAVRGQTLGVTSELWRKERSRARVLERGSEALERILSERN